MAKFYSFLFFSLVLISQYHQSQAFFSLILDVIELGEFMYDKLKPQSEEMLPEGNSEDQSDNENLMKQMELVIKLNKQTLGIATEIRDDLQQLPKKIHLEAAMNDVSESISAIDDAFEKYMIYKDKLNKNNKLITLEKFALSALSPFDCGLKHHLLRIQSKFLPNSFATNKESTISYLILTYRQNYNLVCTKNKSPNMMLSELYYTILQTEAKGLVVTRFALEVLETYGHTRSNYTADLDLIYYGFRSREDQTKKAFKQAMKLASRSLWACEPDINKKSVYRLRTMHRQIITNKLNSNNNEMFCKFPSKYASTHTTAHPLLRYSLGTYPCESLFDCQPVTSDMCQIMSHNQLIYGYYRKYGRPEECFKNEKAIFYEDSNPDRKLDYCMCSCMDQSFYFSTMKITAEFNHVVTGVRFAVVNYPFPMLHIEIQQGVLLANGSIDSRTLKWKSNKKYPEFFLSDNYRKIDDVTKINLFAQDISDLNVKEDFNKLWIVTGLQLSHIDSKTKPGFAAEVTLRTIYTFAGRFKNVVYIAKTLEKGADEYALPPRNEDLENGLHYLLVKRIMPEHLDLKNNDSPIYASKKSEKVSRYDQYLNFQLTSDKADNGQTVIPFIDLQPVVTNPSIPLAGAALYYKANPGYGGFLGIEIRTINFNIYM